jgi:Bacterial PH domain
MVTLNQVEEQLKKIGCNFRFWGRPEIRELRNILVPGETIAQAVNGRYEGGFALLVVTDHRLLLIDKKPMFLTLEDIRFDMISEIDYSSQLLEGTIRIMTPNRRLSFTGWNQARLRILLNYLQERITHIRHHYLQQQFQPQNQYQPAQQFTAPVVGSLVMQGNAQRTLPSSAYTRVPLIMRRRRVPKFY